MQLTNVIKHKMSNMQ